MQPPDEIFLDARQLRNVGERIAFLDRVCAGDAELRAAVERMLHDAERADAFFETSDVSSSSRFPIDRPGAVIGRYILLEQIGEGGMGAVYMAEQREPVQRKVALKIIKAGMDTQQVIARFEAERQVLALMDHPNIAKVHDGGATEAGRPYFVMELVRGVPITQHCDDHNLSIRERLKLFVQVCQAVQHAHQKGIIHRDLKPSNILVTVNDDVALPKVIDFGVAKAIQQEPTEKAIFTQFHHFIGTPASMSPEQAEMSSADIDTRSDIYSLGVLLYELLTGQPPFDSKQLLASGLDEMRKTIREKEPLKPSARLFQGQISAASKIRNPKPAIDPDLDCIVMKCLEKDRDRRYEMANGVATDILRFLTCQPVTARPPTVAYRLKKSVRRNKVAFSAATLVVLALLAGVAVSSWQAVRASRETARAERRLDATLQFVESVFSDVSEKLQNLIGGATANEILNTKGFLLMQELQQDVGENPQFDFTLGKLYTQLAFGEGWFAGNTSGNYDAAFNAATQAVHLFTQLGDTVPRDERARRLARAEVVAGFAAMALHRPEEGLAHFREMGKWGDLAAQSGDPNLRAEGTKLRRWAVGCTGEALEALGQVEEALRDHYLPFLHELESRNVSAQSKNLNDLHDLVAASRSLGRVYNSVGQFEVAAPYLRQAEHLLGVLRSQNPNHAQYAAQHTLAEAELGRFLLAQGSHEGLKYLESATNNIRQLVVRDRANVSFAEHRIKIVQLCALGFAEWSADASVSVLERQERAHNAQQHLDRAETLLKALRPQALCNSLDAELEDARQKVAAAKAKLGLIDGAPPETPRGGK